MSKREMKRMTQEIQEDLLARGIAEIQVDVDTKGIAYVTGNAANRDAEADVVATVLQHHVAQVQDGIIRPGQVPSDLVRAGHIGPYTHPHARSNDPVQQLLRGAHTEERVFYAPGAETTLETGTPLTTGKDG